MRSLLEDLRRLRARRAVQGRCSLSRLPAPPRSSGGQTALPSLRPARVHPGHDRLVRVVLAASTRTPAGPAVRAVRGDGPQARGVV